MLRDIKFRGKRVNNGEWTYGYLFKIWERAYILWGTTNGIPNMIEVIPETVGQYTGLKDKNVKEIYEGDILNLWRSVGAKGQLRGKFYTPLPVVYCNLWTSFTADDVQNKLQYHIWEKFDVVEVIGNIYDNPELLEVHDAK